MGRKGITAYGIKASTAQRHSGAEVVCKLQGARCRLHNLHDNLQSAVICEICEKKILDTSTPCKLSLPVLILSKGVEDVETLKSLKSLKS